MSEIEHVTPEIEMGSVAVILEAFDQVLMRADEHRSELADQGDWESLLHGLVERKSATTRRWDSEGLLQYMVRDVLDPERTGEVNYDRMWDLIEALKKALPFTASLGWRVTALKELGMPVDNFCEVNYGRQTITIAK